MYIRGGGQALNSVLSNLYEVKTLFTGLTYGNFKITDYMSNYNLLRIDTQNNLSVFDGQQCFNSHFIWVVDDVQFAISGIFYIGSTYMYLYNTVLNFVGLNVTQTNNNLIRIQHNISNSTSAVTSNGLYIKSVVGYRKIQNT